MQDIGQTTVMLFGNALDPRGRANHPKPASTRPHGNQMGTVLAKDKPVWRSRYNETLITGRTHSMALAPKHQHAAGHYIRTAALGRISSLAVGQRGARSIDPARRGAPLGAAPSCDSRMRAVTRAPSRQPRSGAAKPPALTVAAGRARKRGSGGMSQAG